MSIIKTVAAFTNGEIAYVSWTLKGMVPGCLGFEITRLYPDNPGDNTVLPAWVAFKGQSNKNWQAQNTSVWPVQKLSWKDLTLRKRRDQVDRRPDNVKIQYKIRPVVAFKQGLEEVKPTIPATYTGSPVRLSYYDEGATSKSLLITLDYGPVRATFTNGVLSTQWLTHAMQNPSFSDLKKDIQTIDNPIRNYLAGDVLDTITLLLDKAANKPNASLKMALYELQDDELMKLILKNKAKVEMVLSNTAKNKQGLWDTENSANRKTLHQQKIHIMDRMFNNAHIGHNKFVIYLENNIPQAVLTGSTNWTSNGLCAQSNNTVIINSPDLATIYNDYFEKLKKDTSYFFTPNPLSSSTKNVQGKDLRSSNAKANKLITVQDGTQITVWYSPNTIRSTVNKTQTPPDLSQVYSIMKKARQAIFFAVFLPGRANSWQGSNIQTNIITEAISLAEKETSLLVYGAISDPTAMPNYASPIKGQPKKPTPFTYDKGKIHMVRAANLTQKDLIGDFQKELLKSPGGHAIIHDKIIVVDPFSDQGAVIFGSHNLGFKASYSNDENLLIIQHNPGLVKAFAAHILDIYEHYRFRAVQAELETNNKQTWDGFLSQDDIWLKNALAKGGKGDLAEYLTNS